MLTTFSNRQEIIDLVWACDLMRHGIQSIVLFGSRAKGTHTTDSDWDLAFLVDDPSVEYVVSLHDYWPGNPFQDYDNVDACVLTPTYLKAHMYDFGQLSHQIARHGEPLLGKWFINTELLDIMTQSRPDDWRRNLSQSYEYLDDFFIYIRKFKEEEDYERIRSIGNGLVITSQRAAEHLVKGIAVRRYIEPRKSHDIAGLADDLWNQRPDDVDQTLWLDFTN